MKIILWIVGIILVCGAWEAISIWRQKRFLDSTQNDDE